MNGSPVRIFSFMIFAAVLFLNPSVRSAAAADVPMKLYGKVSPSHVYRIVVSINKVARYIAQNTPHKEIRSAALAVAPVTVIGKKPSDAVQMVYAIQGQLNVLRQKKGLKPIKRYRREDGRVSPAIVFINASSTLDGLFQMAVNINPQKSIGGFYDVKKFTGKTPSDVYGVADHTARILAVLAREN